MTAASNTFDQVNSLAMNAAYASSLGTPLERVGQNKLECRKQFQNHVEHLLEQLAEVMHPARAARVIAANSRIEASQAGEYLQSLQAVAESVDNAASVIHGNVQRCRSALSIISFSD